MERCKTCKHWTEWKTTCELVDFDFDPIESRFAVLAQADDDQGLEASLVTGPEFGCVKHEPIPNPHFED